MRRHGKSAGGFTLVEIMITVAVLGILAAVAIPYYYDKVNQAKAASCLTNRAAMEKSAIMYFLDASLPDGTPLPSALDLVEMKYLDSEPVCPSKGVYIWADVYYRKNYVPRLGCSIHFIPPD